MKQLYIFGLICILILLPIYTNASDDERLQQLKQLGLDQLYNTKVVKTSLATKIEQTLERAPAVATVITASEIEAMGATDLDHILETVAGFHVGVTTAYQPSYIIRGIYTTYNPQVLLLINGVPITNLAGNGRAAIWGGMPVKNISRVEVIRGPASAIHGSDALTGIINVITKTKEEIQQSEIGMGIGSFNTRDLWLLHGDDWNGVDITVTLNSHNTDGQREIIQSDAQTYFDQLQGTHASLAPDTVNVMQNNIDGSFDLKKDNWGLRILYQKRNVGSGQGIAFSLDPVGRIGSTRLYTDLMYDNPHFTENWGLTLQTNFLYTTQEVFEPLMVYPPDSAIYQLGAFAIPELYERDSRFNILGLYKGINNHKILLGAGYFYADIYKVVHKDNIISSAITGTPTRELTDYSDTPYSYFPEVDRKNWNIFAQDVWTLNNDWELTTGVRYDHYSDFGSTANPRFALVWQTTDKLTTKLLYGKAFRAPTIIELSVSNNPNRQGNPNLKPETIETIELAFNYRVNEQTTFGFNIFRNDLHNMIEFVPDSRNSVVTTAQNFGTYKSYGTELEGSWQISDQFKIQGNYAFQRTTDQNFDHDAGHAPHHQLYLRADWRFAPTWYIDGQLNWVADRERVYGDSREPIDDYTLMNMTLRYKKNDWNLSLTARNLFNVQAYEPSTGNDLAGTISSIPYDYPLAGRSILLEFSYHFNL